MQPCETSLIYVYIYYTVYIQYNCIYLHLQDLQDSDICCMFVFLNIIYMQIQYLGCVKGDNDIVIMIMTYTV